MFVAKYQNTIGLYFLHVAMSMSLDGYVRCGWVSYLDKRVNCSKNIQLIHFSGNLDKQLYFLICVGHQFILFVLRRQTTLSYRQFCVPLLFFVSMITISIKCKRVGCGMLEQFLVYRVKHMFSRGSDYNVWRSGETPKFQVPPSGTRWKLRFKEDLLSLELPLQSFEQTHLLLC